MKALIVAANGIGDGLLMMIAANQLKKHGYHVTFSHPKCKLLKPLTNGIELVESELETDSYEVVIVQNDNSAFVWDLFEKRKQGAKNLVFFHPKPSSNVLTQDFLFNAKEPIGQSIALATAKFLKQKNDMDNGLPSLMTGKAQKYSRRIVINPSSQDPKRNWGEQKYLSLANHLKTRGYHPIFTMTKQEEVQFPLIKASPFEICQFDSLLSLAQYLYESRAFIGNDSGIGHLASNVNIPTLTISGNPKRVMQWRPSWDLNFLALPSIPLINFKGIHMAVRDNFWQKFISLRQVLSQFDKLLEASK